MQRRDLLKLAAGFALTGEARAQRRPEAATAPAAPAAAPAKAKITSSVVLARLSGTFEERVLTAAKAGIQSVELTDEYVRWTPAEAARAKRLVNSFHMGISAIAAGGTGVNQAIEAAKRLDCPNIILTGGSVEQAFPPADNAGITIVITDLKTVRDMNHPRARLLFTISDAQQKQGNVLNAIKEAVDVTAIFHVADAPERHDPGTGGIPFREICQALQKAGYDRIVSMDYQPQGDPVASLIKAVDGFRAALLERPAS